MVNTCAALNCTNRNNVRAKELGITFHRFPKSVKEREKWTIAMKRINLKKKDVYWQPHKYDVLCSKHFLKTCFDFTGKRVRLRDGSVPSLFDISQNSKKKQSKLSTMKLATVQESSFNENQKIDDIRVIKNTKPDPATETTIKTEKFVDLPLPSNLDHSYFFMDTLSLKQKQSDVTEKPTDFETSKRPKRNSVRCTKTTNTVRIQSKQDKSKTSLKSFLENAKESRLLGKCSQELLDIFSNLPLNIFKTKESFYTSEKLEVALILYLFVPKAYSYLQQMKIAVPCPNTLQSWLSHTDGSPGFLEQIFSLLQQKVQEENGSKYKYCSLLMESIPLKKEVHWDYSSEKIIGYVDYGFRLNSILGDSQPVANQMLVIMAVGVTSNWKLPLGYFFLDEQPLDTLEEIVKNALIMLQKIGVSTIGLVLDGLTADFRLFELLGGCGDRNFCGGDSATSGKLKCTFPHPCRSGAEVFAFVDVPYLLLQAKNTLAQVKEIHIPNHGKASWEHIVRLKNVLKKPGHWPVNRLNIKQLFRRQKVKLHLSTQPFTASVANTLQVLRNGKTLGFLESEGTEVFIRILNFLYQIFSSTNPYSKGYQAAMTSKQFVFIQQFLDFTEKFLCSMENSSGEKLIKTKNNFFIVGFLLNIQSLRQIYQRFLVPNKLQYISMSSFQHFHLKSLFVSLKIPHQHQATLLAAHQIQANFKNLLKSTLGKNNFLTGIFTNNDEINFSFGHDASDNNRSNIFVEELCCLKMKSSRLQVKESSLIASLVDNSFGIHAKELLFRLSKSLTCLDCLEICVDKVRAEPSRVATNCAILQFEGNWGLVGASLGFLKIFHIVRRAFNTVIRGESAVYKINEKRIKQLEAIVLEIIPKSFFLDNSDHLVETASGFDNHLFTLIRLICRHYISLCQLQ